MLLAAVAPSARLAIVRTRHVWQDRDNLRIIART
jgi:hypothetical protein